MTPEDVKIEINSIRKAISDDGNRVMGVRSGPDYTLPYPKDVDLNEYDANITLAYRHLEDARMRLGKAIQVLEGGVSIYDGRSG